MAIQTAQKIHLSVGDTDLASIDFTPYLDSGELLTGTPVVVEVTTSDLNLANKVVSTAQLSILEETVAIGKAAQFSIAGQKIGVSYIVRVTVTTNSTPARTKVIDQRFVVDQ